MLHCLIANLRVDASLRSAGSSSETQQQQLQHSARGSARQAVSHSTVAATLAVAQSRVAAADTSRSTQSRQ